MEGDALIIDESEAVDRVSKFCWEVEKVGVGRHWVGLCFRSRSHGLPLQRLGRGNQVFCRKCRGVLCVVSLRFTLRETGPHS